MTSTTSDGKAQQLHALGRSASYDLSQKLKRTDRGVQAAKKAMHDARVSYAKAAQDYRDARRAARTMFTEEQLVEAGFPPMAEPKPSAARPPQRTAPRTGTDS